MTAMATNVRNIELINASYESLGKLSVQKAARLLALGKAVVHEADESGRKLGQWLYPKVLRMVYFVKVNYNKLYGTPQISKHGILVRDGYTCAYCAGDAKTVDHIKPRSRGGKNSWLNLVACCFPCNNRKDDRTPEEAKMKLLFAPYEPTRAQLLGR